MISKLDLNKKQILFIELCGFLHDIGKLSEEFMDYRQKWQKGEDGWYWGNDPHVKNFFDKHDRVISNYVELRKRFNNRVSINGDEISITDAVHWHIKPEPEDDKKDNLLLKMLRVADGIDSAIDRNYPLFSAEQTGIIFDTDVFGAELKSIDPSDLTKHREDLYKDLLKIKLPDGTNSLQFEEREQLIETIKKYFDQGFSDTTRPNNDTSLWEHSYAVASILKVIIVHKEIYGEDIDEYEKVRFGIFGVGWDGLSYISKGHKMADITGRKIVIDEFKRAIKKKVEWDYSIGNSIYEDDNGIFFLVPILPTEINLEKTELSKLSGYGQLLQQLQEEISESVIRLTGAEICPKFHMIQDTKFITQLVMCIQEIRKKTKFPISKCSDALNEELVRKWKNVQSNGREEKKVCPICRLTPVKNEEIGICQSCFVIRKKGSFFRRENNVNCNGTPFVKEIASANKKDSMNKRAALIVANIDLENWLNGKMVRTLFITEAKGLHKELDALGTIKDFEVDENEIRQWLEKSPFGNLIDQQYDYQRVKKEIDNCFDYHKCSDDNIKNYAKKTGFLYGRRHWLNSIPEGWNEILQAAIEEHGLSGQDCRYLLYNVLCSKTPTPSTILDVWNTTQKFFESFRDIKDEKLLGIGEEKRWRVALKKPENADHNVPYEGKIGDSPLEAVWIDDKTAWIIGDIKEIKQGKELFLNGTPFKREGVIKGGSVSDPVKDVIYFPARIITSTPDTFMAIVPADKAIDITLNISGEYHKRFGKVTGRLPLSIGNIFFTEKMPMFAILDAGRRMIDNFSRLHKESINLKVSKDYKPCQSDDANPSIKIDEICREETVITKSLTLEFPSKLGDKHTDYYHPYLMVKKDGRDYSNRKNYFETVAGEVIHCKEVQPGDILEVFPNYYDFEFLDSNSRRYDIGLDDKNRRKSNVANFWSKPFMLDELEQKIKCLWDDLLKGKKLTGITDTKLKNLQSLWLSKYDEWEVDIDVKNSDCYKQWITFVKSSILKEFKGGSEERLSLLTETIENGIFFETLELYLGILKERIDKK